jgi:hypothetical protein
MRGMKIETKKLLISCFCVMFPTKGKGKGYPITAHEGPEVE